jgi:hypothetical protein
MADKKASLTSIQQMAVEIFDAMPAAHIANSFEHCKNIWEQYVLPDVHVVHLHNDVGDQMIYVDD